jgi:hypothetical protein
MKYTKKSRVHIFLHVAKTAGTTLNQVLGREYTDILSFYIPKESKQLFEEFKDKLKNEKPDLIRGTLNSVGIIFCPGPLPTLPCSGTRLTVSYPNIFTF